MIPHEYYMQRCVDLAARAAGSAAPNPMVGAVLVHQDKIIGEGYHEQWGGPHAEVNCIRDADRWHQQLVAESTLYVSLEPCAHHGKTPPCADLIISRKIGNVFVGCRDPFIQVNGKGIEKLRAANVSVTTGILEAECIALNKRFFCFHQRQRPYVILKWAESADRKISSDMSGRVFISNQLSNRLVHKWRAEEAGILVGTNTALKDDPQLTTRLWKGNNPVRLVIDMQLRLPARLKLFDRSVKTIVFNAVKELSDENLEYVKLDKNLPLPAQLLAALFRLNILSVIIEGGSALLNTFIDAGLWDEARVITNNDLIIGRGTTSPTLPAVTVTEEYRLQSDSIRICRPSQIQLS